LLIEIKVAANIKISNFHYYSILIFGHQRELDLSKVSNWPLKAEGRLLGLLL
jgi:hypothetical protein